MNPHNAILEFVNENTFQEGQTVPTEVWWRGFS